MNKILRYIYNPVKTLPVPLFLDFHTVSAMDIYSQASPVWFEMIVSFSWLSHQRWHFSSHTHSHAVNDKNYVARNTQPVLFIKHKSNEKCFLKPFNSILFYLRMHFCNIYIKTYVRFMNKR